MRTNIEIDDKLLKQAMKAAGVTTKRAAVEEALRHMVKTKAQGGLRKLRGKIDFWDDVLADRAANSVDGPVSRNKAA